MYPEDTHTHTHTRIQLVLECMDIAKCFAATYALLASPQISKEITYTFCHHHCVIESVEAQQPILGVMFSHYAHEDASHDGKYVFRKVREDDVYNLISAS